MHNDNTLHREENEHTPKKESSKTKRPSFSYASFFGETGKYDEEESNDNDKQKELAGTLEENVDVSKINDTHENIRAEAIENRLKRFLSIILAVLPTGAISLPIETLSGKTIDGNPLKGHDRLIYSVLAFLKIANVVLLHVLPSILEYDQADGRAKQ